MCMYICIQTVCVNNTWLSLDCTDRQNLLWLTFNERCTQNRSLPKLTHGVTVPPRSQKHSSSNIKSQCPAHCVSTKTPQKAVSACPSAGQHEQERRSRKHVAGWLLQLMSGCMGLKGGQVLLKKSIFCISDQTCENGHKDMQGQCM